MSQTAACLCNCVASCSPVFAVGCSGGGLYAHGAVQPAPLAQSAQPLLRPSCQRARPGSQGIAAECHGERLVAHIYLNWR